MTKTYLRGYKSVCENREEKQQVLLTQDKALTSPVPPRRRLVEGNMGAAPMALGIMMGSQPSPSGLG
jgi:hypothetical protein